MNQTEQIRTVLSEVSERVGCISNVSLGLFGSIRYGLPKPTGSDFDMMLIVDGESMQEVGTYDFMEKLFGNGIKHEGCYSVTCFEEEDIEDVDRDRVQILQAGGMVDVSKWLPDIGGLPPAMEVEFYALRLCDLCRINALEPGGELRQRYNSKPTMKSIMPYNFATTGHKRVNYEQNIELIDDDGGMRLLGDGRNGTFTLKGAIDQFKRYQKKSPGLPRVDESTGMLTPDTSHPIMMGATGDKTLSMTMLVDPNHSVANDVLIPTWERVSRDFFVRMSACAPRGGFASLFQRYNMGHFNENVIGLFNSLYEAALSGRLSASDLTLIPNSYEILK